MSDTTLTLAPARIGYLRGPGFDFTLLLGVPALAIAAGLLVTHRPDLFTLVLLLDLWLLGYHHVIATYTRLCFDRASFAQYRFAVLILPMIVFAATLGMVAGLGLWVIGTAYLYWQWFHYTRQSWGIAQVYRRKAPQPFAEPRWLSFAAFYLLPLWGILARSHQAPDTFLGLEIRILPVPAVAVAVAEIAAKAAIILWIAWRIVLWTRGQLPIAQTIFLLTHFAIFWLGYIVIPDISVGWLVMNVWHNAQYLLFVWLFNNQRFKAGVDPQAKLLSWLSQSRNVVLYFLGGLALTSAIYLALDYVMSDLMAIGSAVVLVYMTLNFHHYIVDSMIWKARKKPMQKVLGLKAHDA